MRIARRLLLYRHAITLARGGLLRWRLETFGLYMPSYPGARPWWRVDAGMLRLLLRRRGHYAGWLAEMRAVRQHGAAGWWQHTQTAAQRRALHDYLERENSEEGDDDDEG